jgi:putative drug exporter of the RND superfamily
MSRRRGAVLLAWGALLLACFALFPSLAKDLSAPDYSVDGSQSAEVERMLDRPGFGASGSEHDSIVFYSARRRASSAAFRAQVAHVLSVVRSQTGVRSVSNPYLGARSSISADGQAAVAAVGLGGDGRARFAHAQSIQKAIARASRGGVQAWLTGFSAVAKDLAEVEKRDSERAEALGVPVALAILLVALGAAAAALIPLAIAGAGLVLTFGVIALLAMALRIDAFLLSLVTMIGVGIGIDYSLFVVARFREELARLPADPRRERRRVNRAIGVAIATSGRTILYSGAIVMLALTSLLAIPAPIFREFVIGTVASVVCALATALTLLPALLAHLGERVNAGRLSLARSRAGSQPGVGEGSSWARWARAMMRRPLTVALSVSVLLVALAMPVHDLKYGLNVGLSSLTSTPSGKAVQVLARSFSPGMAGPVEVVLPAAGDRHATQAAGDRHTTQAAARYLARSLRADRRVASVAIQSFRDGAVVTVVPSVPVDSSAASALVRRLRGPVAAAVLARTGVRTLVGGWSGQAVDVTDQTVAKLPVVVAITLGVALLFLLVVFRSVLLPLKAVAMNLLATGAALGLVVFVFQQGHGGSLLSFSTPGYLQTFLPICMFVLLFGLSMDYEVFLIRRIQESWRTSGDNEGAVVSGIAHTARPISAAAGIMVVVFGSFVTASILELKQFGFALAAAIAIDVTLIRLMLVPALMRMLGERNWWLPRWLERALPQVGTVD